MDENDQAYPARCVMPCALSSHLKRPKPALSSTRHARPLLV